MLFLASGKASFITGATLMADGDWSICNTWSAAIGTANPAISSLLQANGLEGYSSWPDDPSTEALRSEWLKLMDPAAQRRMAAEIQEKTLTSLNYISVKQFYLPTAYRRTLNGVINSPISFLLECREALTMSNPYDPRQSDYPRDMVGYGRTPPDPKWPGGAAIAVQIVVNYEEGGENNLLHGDPGSEYFLTEHITTPALGRRHLTAESLWEYGSRAGFWRLWRELSTRKIPVTCYGVTMALGRNPEAVAAMNEADWEIATHGLRWNVAAPEDPLQERQQIEQTLALHEAICGAPALGWYNRSSAQTYRILSEIGGMLYFADNYADDLPFWADVAGKPELFVPYTLDVNDMRFATNNGFASADQFYTYLRDTFDTLYREGLEGQPKMMSLGLHGRLSGRPGRSAGLVRFLDHILSREKVWLASRAEIARHWRTHHPPAAMLRTRW